MIGAVPAAGRVGLPEPAVPAEEVRRLTRDVLARPEFAEASPSPLQRLREWVAEQIGQLLQQLAATGRGPLIGTAVLLVAVVVVLWLAVRLIRGTRRDVGVDRGLVEVGRPATDWRAEAAAHVGAGRWRQALRAEYRALVADLAAAGVLDEVPGRTARELLAVVAAERPAAAGAFAAATDAFEAAWYAHAPVDVVAVERFRERADEVRAAAAPTAAGAAPR